MWKIIWIRQTHTHSDKPTTSCNPLRMRRGLASYQTMSETSFSCSPRSLHVSLTISAPRSTLCCAVTNTLTTRTLKCRTLKCQTLGGATKTRAHCTASIKSAQAQGQSAVTVEVVFVIKARLAVVSEFSCPAYLIIDIAILKN